MAKIIKAIAEFVVFTVLIVSIAIFITIIVMGK